MTFESSNQCRVASGDWTGPYTNTAVDNPSDLDIDHMVPLANAHRSGGWTWSKEQKASFANDISFRAISLRLRPPQTGPREAEDRKSGVLQTKPIGALTP